MYDAKDRRAAESRPTEQATADQAGDEAADPAPAHDAAPAHAVGTAVDAIHTPSGGQP